jgi:acyl-CoA thioester hydrolase
MDKSVKTEKKNYTFSIAMSVRDHELDIQGIVNNAVYLNYLEHARHEYLKLIGLDFVAMHKEGLDPVVVRMELDYKTPLVSGDVFEVRLNVETKGRLQLVFDQAVFRLPDEKVILYARVFSTCLKNGKPVPPDMIVEAILKSLEELEAM